MCKACRQRSIWARIKLFSLITAIIFHSPHVKCDKKLIKTELKRNLLRFHFSLSSWAFKVKRLCLLLTNRSWLILTGNRLQTPILIGCKFLMILTACKLLCNLLWSVAVISWASNYIPVFWTVSNNFEIFDLLPWVSLSELCHFLWCLLFGKPSSIALHFPVSQVLLEKFSVRSTCALLKRSVGGACSGYAIISYPSPASGAFVLTATRTLNKRFQRLNTG